MIVYKRGDHIACQIGRNVIHNPHGCPKIFENHYLVVQQFNLIVGTIRASKNVGNIIKNGNVFIHYNGMVALINNKTRPFDIKVSEIDDLICAPCVIYSRKYNKIAFYRNGVNVIDAKNVSPLVKYIEWLPSRNTFIFSDIPITRHNCKHFIKKEITPSYERSICDRCGKNWLETTPKISQTLRITAPDIYITFDNYYD